MPRLVHIVTTRNFAGTERYVCDVARETAARGWDVSVVGGDPERMRSVLGDQVRWAAGATPFESLWAIARLGRQNVCHAHMTLAEAVSVSARGVHRAPIVSTRHFASVRGASRAGYAVAPWVASHVARELAVSEYVARHLERRPDAVLLPGTPTSDCLWRRSSRVVLVLQRLEREKNTLFALRAWEMSRLAGEGWSLRIVGAGSERAALEAWAHSHGLPAVSFAGWTEHVPAELGRAGILLATAPAEPLGLGVIEAMAAGVPVAASAAGGHLETVGLVREAALFGADDARAAAAQLARLANDDHLRAALSEEGRRVAATHFTLERHVDALLEHYETAGGLPARVAA